MVNYRHNSYKLQEDFNKYGIDEFSFEILETVRFKNDNDPFKHKLKLIYLESLYIQKYNSFNNGYNCEDTINKILNGNKIIFSKDLDKFHLESLISYNLIKMRPDKEMEIESQIFEKSKQHVNSSSNYSAYTLSSLHNEIKTMDKFSEVDLKQFRKLLCEMDLIKMKNFSYHVTEKSLKNNILQNGVLQKNKHGYTYNQIIVTDYGREYIIDRFKEVL